MPLASGGGDGTVRLWDPANGNLVGDPLKGHISSVTVVERSAWSGWSHLAGSGSNDGWVRLWDPTTSITVSVLHIGVVSMRPLPGWPSARLRALRAWWSGH